jgi:hypothetical protein
MVFPSTIQAPGLQSRKSRCDRNTHQIELLAKVVNQTFANQSIVLIVTRIVPVIQESAKHSAGLPPIVWWVQYARITPENVYTFVVNGSILRNELFGDLGGDILD